MFSLVGIYELLRFVSLGWGFISASSIEPACHAAIVAQNGQASRKRIVNFTFLQHESIKEAPEAEDGKENRKTWKRK